MKENAIFLSSVMSKGFAPVSATTQHLEQELHQQVDNFFVELDRYLSNYLQSLQQAQSDHQLDLGQRETLFHSLPELVPKATDYIERTDRYLTKTQQMLAR